MAITTALTANSPVVYYTFDDDTGQISISAYELDDPEWENNHIDLCELRGGKINKHESICTIVGNVLAKAGVAFRLDNSN